MGKEKYSSNGESVQRVEKLSDLLPALQSGAQVAAKEGLRLSQDSKVLAQHYGGPIVWDFFGIKLIMTNDTEALKTCLRARRSRQIPGTVPSALWNELSNEILTVLKQFPNYVVESEYLGINAGVDQSIRIWHRDGAASSPIDFSNRLRIVRTLHGPSTEYSESERGPIVKFKKNSLCVHTCGPKGALHRSPRNGTNARISYAIMLRPV